MNFNLYGNCFCQTKAAHVALRPLVWWIFIPVFHIDVRESVKLQKQEQFYVHFIITQKNKLILFKVF